jgi:hypothetical protein
MLIAFRRQRSLRERAPVFRLYAHCLPCLFVRPEGPLVVVTVICRTPVMSICPALSHTAGSHVDDARSKRHAACGISSAVNRSSFVRRLWLLLSLSVNGSLHSKQCKFRDWTWTDGTRTEQSSAWLLLFVHNSLWKSLICFGSESFCLSCKVRDVCSDYKRRKWQCNGSCVKMNRYRLMRYYSHRDGRQYGQYQCVVSMYEMSLVWCVLKCSIVVK